MLPVQQLTGDDTIASYKSLIFLHVPKTAGTTLSRVIDRQYPQSAIYTLFRGNPYNTIEDFKALSDDKRKTIRCLRGHFPFGLHAYLPRPSTYVMLLREPTDRIISHYYYVLSSPNHYLHRQVTEANMSLGDYVSSGISDELTNGQTRLLVGEHARGGGLDSGALQEAKRNLSEYFLVAGLTEQFDRSLMLMKRRLGWGQVFYVKKLVSSVRPQKSSIPESTLRLIERENELDMEVYSYAERLFMQELESEGSAFEAAVKRFRMANRGFALAARWFISLRNTARKVTASANAS